MNEQAQDATLTTAGQPAHLSPEQIEQAAQDVTGMISTARSLLLIGGPESIDGASYILDHAFQRMSQEVQPAIEDHTLATAPTSPTRPLDDDVQHLSDLIATTRNALVNDRPGASAAAVERLGIAADVLKQKIEPRTREASDGQPVRPGAMLVDERRFYGALRILHDAIVATESTMIEDEGAHRALTVLSDALRDAADPAKIGN